MGDPIEVIQWGSALKGLGKVYARNKQEASRPESSAAFKIKNLYMILGIYCMDTVQEYS